MPNDELKTSSKKRSVLVAMGCGPAGIALLLLFPFVGWMLVYTGGELVPNGSVVFYDGFHLRGTFRGGYSTLEVADPLPTNFFVLIDGDAIPIDEISPEHLMSVGFEPHPSRVNGYRLGVVSSVAQFDQSGKLMMVWVKERVPVSFSSSKNGPWLKLPVDFDEVKQQFGKPNEWRYTYGSNQFI